MLFLILPQLSSTVHHITSTLIQDKWLPLYEYYMSSVWTPSVTLVLIPNSPIEVSHADRHITDTCHNKSHFILPKKNATGIKLLGWIYERWTTACSADKNEVEVFGLDDSHNFCAPTDLGSALFPRSLLSFMEKQTNPRVVRHFWARFPLCFDTSVA